MKVRPENLKLLQTSKAWSQSLNGKAVAMQKQGDYLVAEDIWTGVLDVLEHSDDIETVKVLYSNRSACRLKRGAAKLALADAEKCVEMDMTWEKGWLRKIDAVEALGEIVRAYDVALDASKILGFAMICQIWFLSSLFFCIVYRVLHTFSSPLGKDLRLFFQPSKFHKSKDVAQESIPEPSKATSWAQGEAGDTGIFERRAETWNVLLLVQRAWRELFQLFKVHNGQLLRR